MHTGADSAPRSLYVHVPWCVKKCPYCDFNSHALRYELPESAYVEALLADLDAELGRSQPAAVDTVFIGGGTPSLLSPEAVARLIAGIDARMALSPDCEITLEANPGTVEAGRFEGFRAAGVNRLSIGVQSFDDDLLRAIGRIHGGREARNAAEMASRCGFQSVNLDLMYALPGQSVAKAMEDVDTAMALEPTHISFYQLTLEPNTLFYRQPPVLPAEDAAWRMSTAGIERLEARGYRRYEISAFAREGFQCRHNLNYWRFGDYVGIGAGAHGKLSDLSRKRVVRSVKKRHPRAYLDASPAGGFDLKRERLDPSALLLEFMMNALRLTGGFGLELFVARTGLSLHTLDAALDQAQARGLVSVEDGVLRPAALGLCFLDELVLSFAPARPAAAPRAPSSAVAGEGLL